MSDEPLTNDKPLTVADLIRALSKLPPNMEIQYDDVGDFFKMVVGGIFPYNEGGAALGIYDGKLTLIYDDFLPDAQPLDFSE